MPDSGSSSNGQWVTEGSESRPDADACGAELWREATGGFRLSGNTGSGSEYRAGSWRIPRRVTLGIGTPRSFSTPNTQGTRRAREAKDPLYPGGHHFVGAFSSALLRARSVRRREKREPRPFEDVERVGQRGIEREILARKTHPGRHR